MGNTNCSAEDVASLAAAARDFCPFPDYSPGPLYNILSANSSAPLSEHYAAVQASLTPQQQQDFTRSLRSTFGKEGKVSYGGVGVVALSLAVLFDTVARQVKGEYVSDQEPIPGLFLKNPRGTYIPPVYIISKYLRLVPRIANNPSRMINETERHLLELKRAAENFSDTTQQMDITLINFFRCNIIGEHMLVLLSNISDKTVVLDHTLPGEYEHMFVHFNCDPKVASERFLVGLPSLGNRTNEAFKKCEKSYERGTAIENIVWLDLIFNYFQRYMPLLVDTEEFPPERDFDLKAKALGKWI